ncbi:MAG TPA: Rieske 2Fe-2S domain-containing protein [Candidatus Baltobacteraceae bacterium]|nr:Rieske 2Fe-2S domain-containing protein [Candidatus Baltobacteraceae bacterium]
MSRAERAIVVALSVAIVGSMGFIAAYAADAGTLWEGFSLAVASAAFAAAALGWAFGILPQAEVVDRRDEYPSQAPLRSEEDRQVERVERGLSRNGALLRLVYAAVGVFGLALLVPIRSFGPPLDSTLFHTRWRKGLRLVRPDGSAVRVGDLEINSVVTVFPEGALDDALSTTTLIRVPPDLAQSTQGYIAYSKVCTHAGCPVALYRQAAKELMCPCHQSVFDVLENGRVVSGPADHSLPRLPIATTNDGYVIALGDYPEPVGPGFWQRGEGPIRST